MTIETTDGAAAIRERRVGDYRIGLSTLDAETSVARLPVEGDMPSWLAGSLLRTGPARFEAGERELRHWFDGMAMLHRFTFSRGEVSYANRYLRSRAYTAALEGRVVYNEFATDPCRSIFRRAMSLFSPDLTDNGAVNVTRLGEEYLALTESPLPVSFDPQTLETVGLDRASVPGQHPTAHPHHDRRTGELLNHAVHFGPRSEYRVFAMSRRDEHRRIASVRVKEPGYMHSFGVSERYAILTEFPLVVNPLSIAVGRRPFIENFRWEPERGARFIVIDRIEGRLARIFETEACFSFHHVNAYEDGDELVMDLAAYDDADIVQKLYLSSLRDPEAGIPTGELRRYRMNMRTGTVASEAMSEESIDLPRINYGRCNARPYRYVYGFSTNRAFRLGGMSHDFVDQLVKIDLEERSARTWFEPGCYPGEAVFVPSPDAEAEDDGVALSLVLDARRQKSFLLVLDARSFEEVARAEMPHAVPFGFHGQYMTNA